MSKQNNVDTRLIQKMYEEDLRGEAFCRYQAQEHFKPVGLLS